MENMVNNSTSGQFSSICTVGISNEGSLGLHVRALDMHIRGRCALDYNNGDSLQT